MHTKTAKRSNEVEISLERAPSDPPQFSDEYQEVLRKLIEELKAVGVNVTPYYDMQAAAGISGGLNGDFTILSKTGSALATIIVAWLHGRYGRKAKLTVNDTEIEIEGSSAKDVERLLKLAQEHQRESRSKLVHE